MVYGVVRCSSWIPATFLILIRIWILLQRRDNSVREEDEYYRAQLDEKQSEIDQAKVRDLGAFTLSFTYF